MATGILKKITVRDVLGGKPDIKKIIAWDNDHKGETLELLTIVGRATGAKDKVSVLPDGKESPYYLLNGIFEAKNLENGKTYKSGAAILPAMAGDLIAGVVQSLDKGSAAVVDFGFKIGVRFDDTAATHYVYVAESLIDLDAVKDPLAMVKAQAGLIVAPSLIALPPGASPTTPPSAPAQTQDAPSVASSPSPAAADASKGGKKGTRASA